MQINVDVTDISLDSVVGDHRVYDPVDGCWDSAPMTLGQSVAKEIADRLVADDEYKTLRRQVLELRTEEVRRQLEPIVTAAIEKPVQRTNSFGDPVGEPTTLTDLIVKEAREYLAKGDGYGRETVLQKTVREAVGGALKKELAAVVAEEKEKVVAAVRAKAAELIAEAVKQGVGR